MRYLVSSGTREKADTIVLDPSNWNDFGFITTFYATYYDKKLTPTYLGCVKIARYDASADMIYTTASDLQGFFKSLPDDYVSLWQAADDYKRVYELLHYEGINVFKDLRDIAYDLDILYKYSERDVVVYSLMRGISLHTVEKQFHRIAHGGLILKAYSFSYHLCNPNKSNKDLVLDFESIPNSLPPTNIHCIIGPNGSGKTSLLKAMIEGIVYESRRGFFDYHDVDNGTNRVNAKNRNYFNSVVCVSFSPFDDFDLKVRTSLKARANMSYSYIGLHKHYSADSHKNIDLLQELEDSFLLSYVECIANKKKTEDLIDIFSIFDKRGVNPFGYDIRELERHRDVLNIESLKEKAKKTFGKLSAGHKSVLSILVRCLDKVSEKTILFLDEPENHLQPPLLLDFIRCLSEIMRKRNGIALISTHSPIVLQEVPSSCIWCMRRYNQFVAADRLDFQTFGANIGVLTSRVFGHELYNSGFVELLRKEVANGLDYESIVEKFNHELGEVALSVLRVLIAEKGESNETSK